MTRRIRGLVLASWRVLALPLSGVFFCLLASTSAIAAVGRTAGSFSVSNSGAATYTIPIFTPPGPRGVQPSVALTYNSTGGMGNVGRSWSLAGFSSLSRCNKTVAQDGTASQILLQTADAYCLDGNRLRKQSGSYGASGSVYFTEIADFSRITAVDAAGNGPAYWTVERKDGLTYTYGGTSDSRVLATGTSTARLWMVSQIQDRFGNKVRFTYESADSTTSGITHPTKIEWTQTSAGSGSYVYSMDFNYSSGGNALASTPSGYVAETLKKEADLLTSITVSVSSTVKRKYVLTYENSPTTDVKRLKEVKECADSAASDCLSPTTITYQDGALGYNVGSPLLNIPDYIFATEVRYDFNGDGIKDLAYQSWGGTWRVRMGSVSGYGSEINTGAYEMMPGRILNGPADQFVDTYGGNWTLYTWNGSSFSPTSLGSWGDGGSTATLADVDGDGRDDIVYIASGSYDYYNSNPIATYPTVNIAWRRNMSTASTASFASPVGNDFPLYDVDLFFGDEWLYIGGGDVQVTTTVYTLGLVGWGITKGGDFNGDGRQEFNLHLGWESAFPEYYDLGPYYNSGNATRVLTLQGGVLVDVPFYYDTSRINVAVTPQDLNNDGCNDLQYMADSPPPVGPPSHFSNCGTQIGAYVADVGLGRLDWNGDGINDYFYWTADILAVQAGRRDGSWGSAVTSGLPAPASVVGTDANGDGREELIRWGDGSLKVFSPTSGDVPDLAIQFKDGFDVTYNVSYVPISSGHGHYTPGSPATYPSRVVMGGMLVVGSTEQTDGIGGTFTTTYQYFDGLQNLEGRGFLGFGKIETVDSRNSVRRVQKYSQIFPYVGMLIEAAAYQSDNTLISKTTSSPDKYDLDATAYNQRYFSFPASSATDTYEAGGSRNGDWITHATVSNTFDTSGNLTGSTTEVTDKDISSSLYSQAWTTVSSLTFDAGAISTRTDYWCLGLPTAVSATQSSTVSGETTVSQTRGFTPNYQYCRNTAESVGSGALQVDTNYAYTDDFGNLTSVTVTGRNANSSSMSARTASISWGTTGQFPVSETNALSQTTTRTFESTFGSLVTETDPNGIVVASNEYDTFGRPTRSIRPDGTATRITYAACATYGCENGDPASGTTGINKVVAVASERDTGDSQIRDSRTYLDQFERPIVQKAMTPTGGYSRAGTQYDALGRTYRQTAPCDASSCTAYWVTNTYDLAGRLLTQSRPQSQSVSTPVTTTFTYAGLAQTITDPQSKNTIKVMDVLGRMRKSQDHNGYYQNFEYDAAGSLKKVTDSLSNELFKDAVYAYGIKPFLTSSTDMDLGAWSYTYNSLGELVGWTDAKSQSFSQEYDALSRMTSRTEAEGTTTFTWGTSAGSHNIGGLASVSMSGYSESLSFDSVGRLSTRSITTDQTYDIDYAYTSQGLVDTVTYPTSTASTRVKVKHGYAYGILQSVTDWTSGSAGTVYWTANAQNARGQTTQETLGNGVVTNRSFDAVTGLMNSIQSAVGGGTALQNQSYLYDLIGNVTQRQENTQGLTENFYYDNLYRLDHSALNSTTNLSLTYDATGNITSRSDVNGGATWTYNGTKKHAVATTGSGGVSYSYDANGNMTSRAGQTISWSSYNYATGLATATEITAFYYGPDRQYYKQEYTGPSGTEITHYVGGLLEKVYDGSVTDWRHRVMANGKVVAIVSRKSTSTNAVYYPLEDSQGSSSTLTDASGTNLVRQSYNAFGLPRDGADWDGAVPSGDKTTINGISRRGYTGHSMLGDMGLIHMNGRVQDAITGRFLSPDPTIPNAGFTQSYNRYAYVNNNPMSFIDPSGFSPESEARDSLYLNGSMWRVDVVQQMLGFCADNSLSDTAREMCSYASGVLGEWLADTERQQADHAAMNALRASAMSFAWSWERASLASSLSGSGHKARQFTKQEYARAMTEFDTLLKPLLNSIRGAGGRSAKEIREVANQFAEIALPFTKKWGLEVGANIVIIGNRPAIVDAILGESQGERSAVNISRKQSVGEKVAEVHIHPWTPGEVEGKYGFSGGWSVNSRSGLVRTPGDLNTAVDRGVDSYVYSVSGSAWHFDYSRFLSGDGFAYGSHYAEATGSNYDADLFVEKFR